MRFPQLADKIAARRTAAVDIATADKAWAHFQLQVHMLVKEATTALMELLKETDAAYTMRKMASHGEAELKIRNAHGAIEDALGALGKHRDLSSMETAIARLHSPVLRADQEAYGIKL